MTGHQYKALHSFGSPGKGPGEFEGPSSIAVSERTGNIAVADTYNNRVQLFDSELKYLRAIGDKGPGAERIKHPVSVAFTASGDVIVIHKGGSDTNEMFLSTEHGQFIKRISQHLINPVSVSVTTDGHLTVCDVGDRSVKVLSPDGTELVQSFSASHRFKFPWFAVYHLDKFFLSYGDTHIVKVFNKEGVFLSCIGKGHFSEPDGLAIDKFDNLIVCDKGNNRLQVFSLGGKFVNSVTEGMKHPGSVAINKDGNLLVCNLQEQCIHVLQ